VETVMNLVERVKNILLQPASEWDVISAESSSTANLYQGYIIPLAAIGPLASILGMSLFGISTPFGGTLRIPLTNALGNGITSYVLTLVGVFVIARIIDALAPNFGGEKDSVQSLKVAAYASTPSWVAGILMLVPTLGSLVFLASLYGLYILYLGLPKLMKAPQDKSLAYTGVVVVVALVVMVVVGAVGRMFMP
jgi:hypothetical protein